MILSDRDICRRLESGDLVIEPLSDPDLQIQPASVDLRLGREFLEFKRTNIACIHPDREDEVDEYVMSTTVPPGPGGEQTTLGGYDADDRRKRNEFILHPRDFVLGTTMERVEIPNDLIAHVEGRSSLGRLAIVVHASLPADEEVFLWTPEDGYGFHAIGDVVEAERPAWAVAFDPKTLRVSTHRVTDYITNPTKRIFRVTLDSGRRVHVTRDHNLFTLDRHGGVTRIASEAAEGTPVMVPKRLPDSPSERRSVDALDHVDPADTVLYATDGVGAVDEDSGPASSGRPDREADGTPMGAVSRLTVPDDVVVGSCRGEGRLPREIPVTPELGWVIGFYVVAGSVRGNQVRVSGSDRRDLERFGAFFEGVDSRASWDDRAERFRFTVRSALWASILGGLAGSGAGKTVPSEAFEWPADALSGVLQGLRDGGHQPVERDAVTTADPDLVNRVMYLAARLGIPAAVERRRASGTGPNPTSDLDGEGESWTVDVGGDRRPREEAVPVPHALLRRLREATGMRTTEAAEAMGFDSAASVSAFERATHETMTRGTLRRFRDAYAEAGVDVSRLDQILDGGIRFETVVSVEETDRVVPTYDLEVQPGGAPIENFLGGRGGVFLSNTAGIVDPGYRGQITLELSNLGTAPVALTPGMRISQLTFTELSSEAERPYGAERGSKYQDQRGPQASRIQSDHEFHGEQK